MWQNRCSESDRLFLAMVGQLVSWSVGGWSVGGWSVGGWSVGGLVNSRGILLPYGSFLKGHFYKI